MEQQSISSFEISHIVISQRVLTRAGTRRENTCLIWFDFKQMAILWKDFWPLTNTPDYLWYLQENTKYPGIHQLHLLPAVLAGWTYSLLQQIFSVYPRIWLQGGWEEFWRERSRDLLTGALLCCKQTPPSCHGGTWFQPTAINIHELSLYP